MENIKRRLVKGYILLESLLAMALLGILVTVVLGGMSQAQRQIEQGNQMIEALNVAKMALDTGQTHLELNGAAIDLKQSKAGLEITNHGKELLKIENE